MQGHINTAVAGLVVEGVRRYAPYALPPSSTKVLTPEPSIDLTVYREFLDETVALGGYEALLKAGKALEELVDPVLFVLLNSDSVSMVIEKEARLGRFIHSRHRVHPVDTQKSHIILDHLSITNETPRNTEHAAGAGQHITLFEQIGCQSLKLYFPKSEHPQQAVYVSGEYFEPPEGNLSQWLFQWNDFTATRRPMPGLDEILLGTNNHPALQEASPTTTRVESIVKKDLSRTWTLNDIAKPLKLSPRTLQRALAKEQTKFSDVLDQLRTSEAQRLLETTNLSVTNIGYICGFADTSHFSRRFKLRFSTSPSQYRKTIETQSAIQ